nr:FecR domain-containing protein [Rhodoplanes tepidamans]
MKREALDWVVRLTSGTATVADADRLTAWRAAHPDHEAAFRDAVRTWKLLGDAARAAGAAPATAAPARRPAVLGRRALLVGSVAASVAAVAVLGRNPPLGLWPSFDELAADYRTAKGERRRIVLSDDVSVHLNTQSSVAVRTSPHRLSLVAGEAIVTCRAGAGEAVELVAGHGRVVAGEAEFSARLDGQTASVVCLEGDVVIHHGSRRLRLLRGQQARYSADGLDSAAPADVETATAWTNGLLVFKNRPLAEVIDEVNRYRPGRILVTRSELGGRLVNASFHIDRLDLIPAQIRDVFGVSVTELPGGLVLIG